MLQVCVRTADRLVLATGTSLGALPNSQVETLADADAVALLAVLAQPGPGAVLSVDHKTITPAPALPVDPAITAATQERQTASGDLQANYTLALARLDDIVTNGGTFTAAQIQAAVVDEARILRRTLRLLKTVVIG